jgi:hypothetical protein
MKKDDLRRLTQYCNTHDCGEELGAPGGPFRHKRQMTFIAHDRKGNAEYVCLQCGEARTFALNPEKDSFQQVKSKGDGIFVWLLILLLVGVFLCGSCQGLL